MIIAKTNNSEVYVAVSNPQEVLWVNNGLYAIIPIEIVKDELRITQDRNKVRSVYKNLPQESNLTVLRFTWNQVTLIPPEMGKILMEQSNQQSNNQ